MRFCAYRGACALYGENMKKKNNIVIFALVLCLAALLAVSLVACDHNPSDNNGNNGTNQYEKPTYTVTFKTNSDMVLTNPIVTDIEYGSTVSEPKDSNGNRIIPVKRGNRFLWWSKDGSSAYDFTQPVTENFTLTAQYSPLEYVHTPELYDTLVYDAQSGTFKVERTREQNDVGMSDAELNPDTTSLKSKFGTAENKLPCPAGSDSTGEFCFWYYLNDEGQPVQFSKWKAEGENTVFPLESYNFTSGLTLYPMFYDNLPVVTVKFADSLSGAVYAEKQYKFGDNIPSGAATANDKEGYEFDYWYYIVTSKDDDGNEIKEDKVFTFETSDEKTPTSPMDAAQAKDNFVPVELTVYAKWIRVIKIANVADYMAVYNELRTENPTDDEQKRIDQIYTAKINIVGELDFGEQSLQPLFDSEHPFKGTIDGNIYGANNSVIGTAKIKGGYFGNRTDGSVFGYNEGIIKNIVFENVRFDFENMQADTVYVGTVTSFNGGTIDGCAVVYTGQLSIEYDNAVVYGGITARNNGKSSANALLRQCTVNVAGGFTAECKSLVFGGLAGEGNAAASITKCTVISYNVNAVLCSENGAEASGRLVMGGMVGINAGQIRLSTVQSFNVVDAVSLGEFIFGGVAGINTSNLRVVNATVKLGSASNAVKARGSLSNVVAVGGLIGKNEGYILNCYVNAELYVEIVSVAQTGGIVTVGGLVGNNFSDKKDTSSSTESGVCAINYCYSVGEISVKVADGAQKVAVYAGGIAGRNTHKKLGSLFSVMNITVSNAGAKSYVGRIVGKMLNDVATNGNIFFIQEANINVTGEAETQDLGTVTEEANFRDGKWVTGADGGNSVIRFSGTTWEVVDGQYPTFKADVYNE